MLGSFGASAPDGKLALWGDGCLRDPSATAYSAE